MMKKIKFSAGMILISVLFLFSCKKDNPFSIKITDGALIVNEGAYGKSNASVDYFNFADNIITNDIFTQVNGRSLGDVLQSICLDSNRAYLIVNSSNKIEVVSRNDFSEIGVIDGLGLPRYMIARNGKGYVTCWGDSSLKVLDLNSLSITKSIRLGAGPEKMLIHGNQMFVVNCGMYGTDSTISVIDLSSETLSKTIVVGYNPKDIKIDKNFDLWTICYGKEIYDNNYNLIDSSASELVKINLNSLVIVQRVVISDSKHASILDISPDGSTLYYGGGFSFGWIYMLSVTSANSPATKFCEDYSYGFSVDPGNGEVYVLLAPSFTDAGTLNRYDSNGNFLGTYVTGIGPSSAVFINNPK
jgi:hypothetical protein